MGKAVSSATLEPWIRLVSPSGVIIGEHFAASAAQVTVTAPASGTYTVIVGSDRGPNYRDRYDGSGSYLLTLVKAPGALSISPGDEGGLMTNGASHPGTITIGDVDPWSFTATQGDAIVLSMGKAVSSATLQPWIRLVSPTGAIIGEAFGNAVAQVTVTAPANGTYTVIVGSDRGPNYRDRYDGSGSYLLTLVKAPGTLSISPGDDGGPLTSGASRTGSITVGDVDSWSFTATQGDTIVLSVGEVIPNATLAPWIRLVSPTGAIISADSNSAAAQITLAATESGTYTVIVGSNYRGDVTGTGGYVVTLSLGVNGSFSSSELNGVAELDGTTTRFRIELFQPTGNAPIVPNVKTWIVIHGRLNTSATPEIQNLAKALSQKKPQAHKSSC